MSAPLRQCEIRHGIAHSVTASARWRWKINGLAAQPGRFPLARVTEVISSVTTMQLHDAQGKRLYLTSEERVAFLAAAAKAARPVRTFCGVLHTTGCRV